MTKNRRISVDITDPNNVFIHKGGKRKNRVYVIFNVTIGNPGNLLYWHAAGCK